MVLNIPCYSIPPIKSGTLEFEARVTAQGSYGMTLKVGINGLMVAFVNREKSSRLERYIPPGDWQKVAEVPFDTNHHYKIVFDVEAGEVAYYVDDLESPAFKDTGRKDLQPGDRLVLGNYGILTADQTVTYVDEIRITEKPPLSAPEGKVTDLTYTASPRPAAGDREGKALVDGKESLAPGPGQVQWKAFTKEVELVFDWQRERNLSRLVLQACASPATNLSAVQVFLWQNNQWVALGKIKNPHKTVAVQPYLLSLAEIGQKTRKVKLILQRIIYDQPIFTSSPPFSLSFIPIFWQDKVYVQADLRRVPDLPARFVNRMEVRGPQGSLVHQGKMAELTRQNRLVEFPLPIAHWGPGDYLARIVLSQGGKDFLTASAPFHIPEKPDWWHNQIGTGDYVPFPWEPLRRQGKNLSCWGRTYTFAGNTPFPSAVTTQREQILSGPMAIRGKANGKEITWGRGTWQWVETKETRIVGRMENRSPSGLRLTGTVTAEFDGFLKIDWAVEAARRARVDFLSMEIPLRKENARYVRGQLFPGQTKRGFFADCIEENYLWAEYFAHGVWISDEERGLAWGIDSQENWSLDEEDKPVIILNDGQTVHLKLNLITRPVEVREPLKYTMYLMATPVKPLPEGWEKWHAYLYNGEAERAAQIGTRIVVMASTEESLNSPETYPYPPSSGPPAKYMHTMADDAHRFDLKFFGTTRTQAIGQERPDFKVYGPEWRILPEQVYPIHGTVAQEVSANSSWADRFLWITREVVREFQWDGLYFDTSGVSYDANYYRGAGYWDREKKEWKPALDTLATREMYKRLYKMFLEEGKKPPFFFHHWIPSYFFGGFIDTTTFGEWIYYDYDSYDFLFENQCGQFRALFYEFPYGTVPRFLDMLGRGNYPDRKPRATQEEVYTLCLLHNMVPPDDGGGELLRKVWQAQDEFDIAQSEWILYTRSEKYVVSEAEGVLVSLYKKPDRLLLVVGNTGKNSSPARLRLNLEALGWSGRACQAKEVLEGQEVSLDQGLLSLEIPGRNLGLIEVEAP